ncbi:MAG: hypothetical protein QM691_09215 [Opitutaceae bacterium]
MTKAAITSLDFASIWGLNGTLRFPTTPEEWGSMQSVPPPPKQGVPSDQPFDLLANPYGRRPVKDTFRDMVYAFSDSFDEASLALRPHEWRTLYYLDLFPIATLGNPDLDAARVIRDILDRDPSLTDVPREWTGSPDAAAGVLLDIHVTIADMKPDTIKAVWAILSFARSIGMEKHEVLHVPWWSTWWFQSYLVRFD